MQTGLIEGGHSYCPLHRVHIHWETTNFVGMRSGWTSPDSARGSSGLTPPTHGTPGVHIPLTGSENNSVSIYVHAPLNMNNMPGVHTCTISCSACSGHVCDARSKQPSLRDSVHNLQRPLIASAQLNLQSQAYYQYNSLTGQSYWEETAQEDEHSAWGTTNPMAYHESQEWQEHEESGHEPAHEEPQVSTELLQNMMAQAEEIVDGWIETHLPGQSETVYVNLRTREVRTSRPRAWVRHLVDAYERGVAGRSAHSSILEGIHLEDE